MIHIVQNQLDETTNFLNSLKLAISVDFKSICSFNKSLHNCGLAMTKGESESCSLLKKQHFIDIRMNETSIGTTKKKFRKRFKCH